MYLSVGMWSAIYYVIIHLSFIKYIILSVHDRDYFSPKHSGQFLVFTAQMLPCFILTQLSQLWQHRRESRGRGAESHFWVILIKESDRNRQEGTGVSGAGKVLVVQTEGQRSSSLPPCRATLSPGNRDRVCPGQQVNSGKGWEITKIIQRTGGWFKKAKEVGFEVWE